MAIPTDPGINLQDNVKEPVLLGGETGLHERFTRLYNKFDGNVDEDNLTPAINTLLDKIYIQDGARRPGQMVNVGFSFGGTGDGTLTIHQANGSAFADTDGNRGYVWLRSATSGRIIRGKITSNVSIPLVGAHWGAGGKGDLQLVSNFFRPVLRVYVINDGNSSDDFTPKFGICYQAGFNFFQSAQCSTTATNINDAKRVLVNSTVSNNGSPCADIGYLRATFDDTGNANGEDFWKITAVFPGESGDGIWQRFNTLTTSVVSGFSSIGGSELGLFTMIGNTVFATASFYGTSNSTSMSLLLPIHSNADRSFSIFNVQDNGVSQSATGSCDVSNDSNLLSFFKAYNSTVFTAANNKGCTFNIQYEADDY